MVVKILLIVSIVLQFAATVVAIGLVRKTKFNSVWILLIATMLLMTASRVLQFVHFAPRGTASGWIIALTWIDIVISLALTVVLFNARRLVEYIDRLIFQNSLTSKRILSTILRTEEKERSRFSKELHDGMGPLLSSARMSLSALSTGEQSAANLEIIAGTSHVVDEAIRSLREISNNLSPHILNDFGLGRGVANFVSKLPADRMEVTLETNLRSERFPADIEVILYRVVCELVNNSLKHSGGSRATVRLNRQGGRLALEYSDDGRGFVPSAMMDVGMGLSNIASRVASLKGVCRIDSTPGHGMRASIEIDLGPK